MQVYHINLVLALKGHLVRKRLLGYRVPFKKQIERLLNLPEIWHFFQNPRVSNDHIHRDVCDSSYVKEHALNANPQNFLKIALYYDDIEIQNLLQSSQKYKLAMFYFQILNIPVEFHSKFPSFFLLGICKKESCPEIWPKSYVE